MRVSSRFESAGGLRSHSRGRFATSSHVLFSQRYTAPQSMARIPGLSRHERYLKLRTQRRRQGILWALLAGLALLCAWDIAVRIDEGAYNPTSQSE